LTEFHTDSDAAGQQHSDIAPELRLLAQSILDRLDPAVRLLAGRAQAGGSGKCEQMWCPVCAVVALISGEQHPLLDVVAEHSVGLLTLIKTMLTNLDSKPPQPQDPPPGQTSQPGPTPSPESGPKASPEPGRYQPITVHLDEPVDSAEPVDSGQ